MLLFTETPDSELITLQHELAALLRPPQAATEPEHSIQTMKTETALLDAPGAGPELLIHEWAENGECTNPEKIAIDFGKKAGLRQCTVWLGAMPDGTWRWGGYFRSRIDKGATTQPCVSKSPAFPTRAAALKNALGVGLELFRGDADGTRAIAGFLGKLFPEDRLSPNVDGEAPPAKPVPTDSRPLPKPRFAELALKSIDRNPEQARKDFLPGPMKEIADSIASVGLLEPIVVRKLLPDELGEFPEFAGQERFELIAGERRHRAFVMLERETIPCMIYEGLTRAQAAAPSLVENLQREGLNAIEEALGYRDLMAREGLTQEQCAQRVGKSRPAIANALRMLELPEEVLTLIRQGMLSAAHGTALARFKAFPKAAVAIAKCAAAKKSPTSELEEGLPFAEELEKAGLALDLYCEIQDLDSVDHSTYDKIEKANKKTPGFFFFEGGEYDDSQGFVLDLDAGKKIVEEYRAAAAELEKKREAKEARRVSGSDDDGEGGSGGGMSPAEKRARQKKLDENLANRLQTSAMKHAALERLKTVEGLDVPALLIVCCEGLKYDSQEIEEVAERIGIKLPKDFEEPDGYGFDHGDCLTALAKLKPADVVRLLAAALVMRDHDGAMRFASDLPSYAEFAARFDVRDPVDAPSYVAEWKKKIAPLVTSGRTSDEIAKELGCPDYIAEQLRKQIRRELRTGNAAAASVAKPKDGPKPADKSEKVEASDLDNARREFIANAFAAGKLDPWIAKELGLTIPALHALIKRFKVSRPAAAKAPASVKKIPVAKAKKKGSRAVITDETRAQTKRLVEQGRTGGEIAKLLGISLPSVQNIKKALGLVRR